MKGAGLSLSLDPPGGAVTPTPTLISDKYAPVSLVILSLSSSLNTHQLPGLHVTSLASVAPHLARPRSGRRAAHKTFRWVCTPISLWSRRGGGRRCQPGCWDAMGESGTDVPLKQRGHRHGNRGLCLTASVTSSPPTEPLAEPEAHLTPQSWCERQLVALRADGPCAFISWGHTLKTVVP